MPKIISALALLFATTALAQSTMTWSVAGVQREALVYAPAVRTPHPPLVLVFHGHGGNVRTAVRAFGIQTLWPEAVVVYMQGLPTPTTVDPQGRLPGWQRGPGEQGDRDLKFVDTVLAAMRMRYAVDDDRVFATGFSNGAIFTYLLWAQRGKAFAGFAVCAGLLLPDVNPILPRSLLHIAGEADPLVPFDKQIATIERARKIDAATDPGKPCGFGCTKYLSLTSTPVVKIVHAGGHVYIPAAPKLTVEFFKQQVRR